jgi:integrase
MLVLGEAPCGRQSPTESRRIAGRTHAPELLGLKVSDIDFKRGTIRVERQRNQAGVICPPKAAKSRRTVPVGEVVTDALLSHLAKRPSRE